jgi:hypothetical protein
MLYKAGRTLRVTMWEERIKGDENEMFSSLCFCMSMRTELRSCGISNLSAVLVFAECWKSFISC